MIFCNKIIDLVYDILICDVFNWTTDSCFYHNPSKDLVSCKTKKPFHAKCVDTGLYIWADELSIISENG